MIVTKIKKILNERAKISLVGFTLYINMTLNNTLANKIK